MNRDTLNKTDANRDPITGEPGAHPVGAGLGAAGAGAAAGALGGAVAGPVGAAVGAVIGGVAGGLAGKGVAEQVNPTTEDAYWRENYKTRDYVNTSNTYDDYGPAYRTGYEGYSRYSGRGFDDAETDLRRDYEKSKGTANLDWDQAKHAARDAWHRIERNFPTDADRGNSTTR